MAVVRHLIRECKRFSSAISYFTRIPAEYYPGSGSFLHHIAGVGLLAGALSAMAYAAASLLFSHAIAVLFAMSAGLLVTGALHEDGLIDFADGIGAGGTRDRMLAVMKDPRAGSYGVVAIVMLLLFRFHLLQAIEPERIAALLCTSHLFSRLVVLLPVQFLPNARANGSKSLDVASPLRLPSFLYLFLYACAPLLWTPAAICVRLFGIALLLSVLFTFYIRKKIGGYTGDALGALQQIVEVAIYLGYIGAGV